MKVGLYCRVSTSEQTTSNQALRLTEFAKSKGWAYDLYEETESTRKTRPIKSKLLEKLRAGIYDGVVVYKLDRWARSSTELVLEIDELTKKKIAFLSLSDNLDFSSATGRLHFQILSAFAEFERELIRERTLEGLHRARSQGKTIGRPKGSKDGKKRKRSGYLLREAKKRRKMDEARGVFKQLEEYL